MVCSYISLVTWLVDVSWCELVIFLHHRYEQIHKKLHGTPRYDSHSPFWPGSIWHYPPEGSWWSHQQPSLTKKKSRNDAITPVIHHVPLSENGIGGIFISPSGIPHDELNGFWWRTITDDTPRTFYLGASPKSSEKKTLEKWIDDHPLWCETNVFTMAHIRNQQTGLLPTAQNQHENWPHLAHKSQMTPLAAMMWHPGVVGTYPDKIATPYSLDPNYTQARVALFKILYRINSTRKTIYINHSIINSCQNFSNMSARIYVHHFMGIIHRSWEWLAHIFFTGPNSGLERLQQIWQNGQPLCIRNSGAPQAGIFHPPACVFPQPYPSNGLRRAFGCKKSLISSHSPSSSFPAAFAWSQLVR